MGATKRLGLSQNTLGGHKTQNTSGLRPNSKEVVQNTLGVRQNALRGRTKHLRNVRKTPKGYNKARGFRDGWSIFPSDPVVVRGVPRKSPPAISNFPQYGGSYRDLVAQRRLIAMPISVKKEHISGNMGKRRPWPPRNSAITPRTLKA